MRSRLDPRGSLALVIPLLLALAACGSEGNETRPPTPGSGGSGASTTSTAGSGAGGGSGGSDGGGGSGIGAGGGSSGCEGQATPGTLACDGSFSPMASGAPLDLDATDYAYTAALTIDGAGNPVAAWHEMADSNYSIVVKAWTGTAWELLGDGPVDIAPGSHSQSPALAADCAGNAVVAWGEDHSVYVKRWDGAAWQLVGDGPLDVGSGPDRYASQPQLAVDSQGNAVVAWYEWDASLTSNVYVKRWNGSTWELLGDGPIDITVDDAANAPSVALDPQDRPVVAWNESDAHTGSTTRHETFVKRWDGSAWELLGGGAIAPIAGIQTYSPKVRVDSSGAPVVALYELLADGSSSQIYVVRLEDSAWSVLGGAIAVADEESGNSPSLALDGSGAPVVAWNLSTATNNDVRLSQWTGTDWSPLGPAALDQDPTQTAYGQVLAIDPEGKAVVVWNEWSDSNASFDIYASRCQ